MSHNNEGWGQPVRTFEELSEVLGASGSHLGVSPWVCVDQEQIDAFAAVTNDHQWIHVDVARARNGPFGGTVAHGYLTLSLLPSLGRTVYAFAIGGPNLNYGLDRVRFPQPLVAGARVRADVTMAEAVQAGTGVRVTLRWVVEMEGKQKPACVADSLVLLLAP
jgi:acyl dehydratase